jgi:hypothetical protein
MVCVMAQWQATVNIPADTADSDAQEFSSLFTQK